MGTILGIARKCWGAFGRSWRTDYGGERVSLGKAHSEAVRGIDGEQAYEKMRRAMEKASQEKARQVERARQEWRDPRSFRRAKGRSAVGRNAADQSGTMAPAAGCGSAGAWEPSLPARGELASNAVLRSSLAQTLAAIGVDTEIEMRSAALRHRQAIAQPVVAPVPGGPDAEARHSDQTPPDRHPVAEFGMNPNGVDGAGL